MLQPTTLYESLQNHQLSVQQQPKYQLCASGTIIMCIYKSIKLLPIDPGMISNLNYLTIEKFHEYRVSNNLLVAPLVLTSHLEVLVLVLTAVSLAFCLESLILS